MRPCKLCSVEKGEPDFYANDKTCKECRKAAVSANYRANREHYREYERQRAGLQHRVEARSEYAATVQGKDRGSSARMAYIKRHPERRAAHVALDNAVRDGRLWKSVCCMAPGCFSTLRLHGHHTHYDNPLSVVWLCSACHRQLHKEFDQNHRGISA